MTILGWRRRTSKKSFYCKQVIPLMCKTSSKFRGRKAHKKKHSGTARPAATQADPKMIARVKELKRQSELKDIKLKALQKDNSQKCLENERIWEKLKLLENVAELLKALRGEYEAKEKEHAEKEKKHIEKEQEYARKEKEYSEKEWKYLEKEEEREKEYTEKEKFFEEGKKLLLKKDIEINVNQDILRACKNQNKSLLKKSKEMSDSLEEQKSEKEKVEELNRVLNLKVTELSEKKNNLEKLGNQHSECMKTNADLLKEIDDKTSQLSTLQNSLKAIELKAELKTKFSDLDSENTNLKEQIEKLKKYKQKVKLLEDLKIAKEKEMKEKEEKISYLVKEVNVMSQANEQLKKDLEEKEKQNWTRIGTKEEFVGLKKNKEYLKSSNLKLLEQVHDLEKKYGEAKTRERAEKDAQREEEDVKKKNKNLTRTISKLQEELEFSKDQVKNDEAAKLLLLERIKDLEESKTKKGATELSSDKEVEQLRNSNKVLLSKNTSLQEENEILTKKLNEKDVEVKTYDVALIENTSAFEKVTDKHQQAVKEIADLKERIQKLESEEGEGFNIKEKAGEKKKALQNSIEIKARNEDLENELKAAKAAAGEKDVKLESLKQKVSEMNNVMEIWTKTNEIREEALEKEKEKVELMMVKVMDAEVRSNDHCSKIIF